MHHFENSLLKILAQLHCIPMRTIVTARMSCSKPAVMPAEVVYAAIDESPASPQNARAPRDEFELEQDEPGIRFE